eukprot:3004986-Amphidinium_carterae.1
MLLQCSHFSCFCALYGSALSCGSMRCAPPVCMMWVRASVVCVGWSCAMPPSVALPRRISARPISNALRGGLADQH